MPFDPGSGRPSAPWLDRLARARSPVRMLAVVLVYVFGASMTIAISRLTGARAIYMMFAPGLVLALVLFRPLAALLLSAFLASFAFLAYTMAGAGAELPGFIEFVTAGAVTAYFIAAWQQRLAERAKITAADQGLRDLVQFVAEAKSAVAMFDRDMRYVAASERWMSDYELSRDIIGKSHYEVIPDLPERWFEAHRRALSGEVVRADEDPFPRPDGSTTWLQWEARPWRSQGQLAGIVIYADDITPRKLAEAAAQRDAERFRLVARATNDVIFDKDLKTRTIWWNDELRNVFGFDPKDFENGFQSWMNRVTAQDRERVQTRYRRWLESQSGAWIDEHSVVRADGEIANVIMRGYLVDDPDGVPRRMIGSISDVTERRKTEVQLREAQKMEAIGQLTGGVAHDFNNLLTVILGNADELVARLKGDPALERLAATTVKAAERGAELTKSLLAFARRQPLEPKPVDIGALLLGLDIILRRSLTEDIELEIICADGVWPAEIDAGQLESAVLNLAINARDAMPDGGRLTIEAINASLDSAYARQNEDVTPGQYVLISVTDTGTGMSAEVAARAFEPFYTTKTAGAGSGLGLSMVHGFVKQSDGHLKIYSEQGEGTTVKLYLPRADLPLHLNASDLEVADLPAGNEVVLIVEDEDLVREVTNKLLTELGYTTLVAKNGVEALAVLNDPRPIDILFTDVVMPGGINGKMLAHEAKKLRPDICILFASGYAENAIVHHGRLDPGVHLLVKPYRRAELALKMRQVLREKLSTSAESAPSGE